MCATTLSSATERRCPVFSRPPPESRISLSPVITESCPCFLPCVALATPSLNANDNTPFVHDMMKPCINILPKLADKLPHPRDAGSHHHHASPCPSPRQRQPPCTHGWGSYHFPFSQPPFTYPDPLPACLSTLRCHRMTWIRGSTARSVDPPHPMFPLLLWCCATPTELCRLSLQLLLPGSSLDSAFGLLFPVANLEPMFSSSSTSSGATRCCCRCRLCFYLQVPEYRCRLRTLAPLFQFPLSNSRLQLPSPFAEGLAPSS
jgi:hypothetical protein